MLSRSKGVLSYLRCSYPSCIEFFEVGEIGSHEAIYNRLDEEMSTCRKFSDA